MDYMQGTDYNEPLQQEAVSDYDLMWNICFNFFLIHTILLSQCSLVKLKNKYNKIKIGYLFSFGSMVQKGKFSAGAALLVKTLKNVDLPTFGTPTMPILKFVPIRPINGLRSGSSCFLGGIVHVT